MNLLGAFRHAVLVTVLTAGSNRSDHDETGGGLWA